MSHKGRKRKQEVRESKQRQTKTEPISQLGVACQRPAKAAGPSRDWRSLLPQTWHLDSIVFL